jgi:hypothetical protein
MYLTNPNELYQSWKFAVARGDAKAAREAHVVLSEWLVKGGFEPDWGTDAMRDQFLSVSYPSGWHIVSDEEGEVLAAFPESRLAEAQATAELIEHRTGLPAYLHHGTGNRPIVGGSISMKGVHKRAK